MSFITYDENFRPFLTKMIGFYNLYKELKALQYKNDGVL